MEKKKRKMGKKTIITLIVLACFLIPIIAYGSYMAYILYFRETPTIVSTDVSSVKGDTLTDIPAEETSGIDNIVLFGVDSRSADYNGRTDSIIIATIDKNSKVVKLSSLMRDLYVKIGSTSTMSRINSAYALGGPELALKTINNNFGLNLQYYAIIDFQAFQKLVDKVGGIDVDVKDYEVNEINYYIKSVNGSKATLLKGPGFQHLNGQQALSYARIRKVGNGDYERTERQRLVLKCIAEKAKQQNILKIPQLLTTLVSYVHTNVPLNRILSLGITAYKFNSSIETMRIPVDGYYKPENVNGASVLVPDISANAQFIKEFIYNMKTTVYKDVPAYMQGDFHMDDTTGSVKPKANIPDYSTPSIPLKPEEKDTTPAVSPSKTGSPTPSENPTGTATPTESPTPSSSETPTPIPTENPTSSPTESPTGTPGSLTP